MKFDLPYQEAKAGTKRQSEIIDTLRGLDAGKVGFMDDYDNDMVICQFALGGRNVTLQCSIQGYAQAWLKANPWSFQRRSTQQEWQKKARAQAEISIWAVLADWVKS